MSKHTNKISLPLLKDNHTHTFTYATLRDCVDLSRLGSKEEAVKAIKRLGNNVNVVLGWNDAEYSFSKAELLNLPPVVICNYGLHNYIINPSAREILKKTHIEVIEKIEDQTWVERHLPSVICFVASLCELNEEKVELHFKKLVENGIWCSEDMCLLDVRAIEHYRGSKYHDRIGIWTDFDTYITLSSDLKKQIKGIKVFTDGGFSSRSAALCDGFKDGSKGVLVRSDDELSELILNISETGKPLAIHALGDRATHQVASVLSNAYNKGIGLKVRVEHCQLVSMEDAIRLKECGVVLCMQPNFSNDSVIFADRLSRKYLERINPLRMLIDDVGFVPGRDLIFGSDGMPHGIKAALEQSLFPPLASQKLKLEEFVAGYCMPDKKNGCIEVEIDEQNKKIDFSVVI